MFIRITIFLVLLLAAVADICWKRIPNCLFGIAMAVVAGGFIFRGEHLLEWNISKEAFFLRVLWAFLALMVGMFLNALGVMGGADGKIVIFLAFSMGGKGFVVMFIGMVISSLYGVIWLFIQGKSKVLIKNLFFFFKRLCLWLSGGCTRQELIPKINYHGGKKEHKVGTKIIMAPGIAIAYLIFCVFI